jgi:hypothetical protein
MVLDPTAIHRVRPDPFQPDVQLPPGMQIPAEIQRPAAPFNPQPIHNNIRGLIQRLRGQVPNQVAPAPEPPQPEQMRSVLKRP